MDISRKEVMVGLPNTYQTHSPFLAIWEVHAHGTELNYGEDHRSRHRLNRLDSCHHKKTLLPISYPTLNKATKLQLRWMGWKQRRLTRCRRIVQEPVAHHSPGRRLAGPLTERLRELWLTDSCYGRLEEALNLSKPNWAVKDFDWTRAIVCGRVDDYLRMYHKKVMNCVWWTTKVFGGIWVDSKLELTWRVTSFDQLLAQN